MHGRRCVGWPFFHSFHTLVMLVCGCVCMFRLSIPPFFCPFHLFFTPLPMSIWYLCSPSAHGPMEFPGLINGQTLADSQKLTSVPVHHPASGGSLLKRGGEITFTWQNLAVSNMTRHTVLCYQWDKIKGDQRIFNSFGASGVGKRFWSVQRSLFSFVFWWTSM